MKTYFYMDYVNHKCNSYSYYAQYITKDMIDAVLREVGINPILELLEENNLSTVRRVCKIVEKHVDYKLIKALGDIPGRPLFFALADHLIITVGTESA